MLVSTRRAVRRRLTIAPLLVRYRLLVGLRLRCLTVGCRAWSLIARWRRIARNDCVAFVPFVWRTVTVIR